MGEKARLRRDIMDRYPFIVDNPFTAIILRAHQKLALHFSRYGIEMLPEETYRQYFSRVIQGIDGIDILLIEEWTSRIEEATYSNHPLGEEEKEMAIVTLRRIEKNLDGIPLGFRASKASFPHIWLIPPPIGSVRFEKKMFPQDPTIRSDRKYDLHRLRGQVVQGIDLVLDKNDLVSIFEAVRTRNHRSLGRIIDLWDHEPILKMHYSNHVLLYILEIGYRMRETLRVNTYHLDGLRSFLISGAGILAMADLRDYVIPDDVKICTFAFMSTELMLDDHMASKMLDSVQVPACGAGAEQEIILVMKGDRGLPASGK